MRQRLFLVFATFGAFAIGLGTGSVLTFGPGPSAELALPPAADPEPSPTIILTDGSDEGAVAPTRLALLSTDTVVLPTGESGGRAGKEDSQSATLVDRAAVASATDQIEASSQANPVYPAALPETPPLAPPAPRATNEAKIASVAQVAKAALTPRPWETQAVKVRRGDSLTTILKRAGIEGRQVHDALRSLRGVYDPRNLRAGQELTVTAATRENRSAQLLSVALDLDFDYQLLITRDAGGDFTTKKIKQAQRRELVRREGNIEGSLYLSAKREAVPNSVTNQLIHLFSWDVDFQRDIRPGDQFETLYEEVTLEKDETQVKGELVYARLQLRGELFDAYLYTPDGGRRTYYDSKGRSLRKFLLRTPIDGARLSSGFGMRKHPVLGYNRLHKGTDFAAPRGTPIYAGGSGKIEFAGRNGGYGNYVRIRHSGTYSTAYAHMSKIAKGMKKGKRVRQGQVIGYVGTPGRSTGPHLHYEVLKNGKQINPMKMKHPPAIQLAGAELQAFKKEVVRIDAERARLAREQMVASRTAGAASQ